MGALLYQENSPFSTIISEQVILSTKLEKVFQGRFLKSHMNLLRLNDSE